MNNIPLKGSCNQCGSEYINFHSCTMTLPIAPSIDGAFPIACKHQWFEVRKLNKEKEPPPSCEDKDCKCKTGSITHIYISEYIYGILVQCANCKETKELYGE